MRWKNVEIYTLAKGNNHKTLETIDEVARSEKDHEFIQRAIERYHLDNSRDSIKRMFDAVYRLVRFYPDPEQTQYVRTVNRMLKDLRGNCVDYTVMLSAFLRAMNVPHVIRMVRTEEDISGYNHIYVTLLDGTPLDPVMNQDQDGTEMIKMDGDRLPPLFGVTAPYINKFEREIWPTA